jgi:hypothetical protein
MPVPATAVQLTFDCDDPIVLAEFWAATLHYEPDAPPAGFSSWPEWLASVGVPESEWNDGASIVDPDGHGPRLYFQKVPERKSVKNRIHLDLDIADPSDPVAVRRDVVDEESARVAGLGGSVLVRVSEGEHYHVMMADPEGNEFDLR